MVNPPTVPCSTDFGGSGLYPAEGAQVGGGAAGKLCSAANFHGSGYIGNWTNETVTFLVNTGVAGRYNIRFRYQNALGTASRQLNTPSGSSTIIFHNTHYNDTGGNWAAGIWSEVIVNMALNAGTNNVSLNGGGGFLDLDEIMEVRYTGPTALTATAGGSLANGTVYQAENAAVNGIFIGAVTDNPGYVGAGYLGNFGYVGNIVAFSVTGGGTRTLRFRYRSADSGAQRLVSINGQSVFLLTFANTGSSWATAAWVEASVTVNLPTSATVTLEFIGDSGFGYIDLDQLTVAV